MRRPVHNAWVLEVNLSIWLRCLPIQRILFKDTETLGKTFMFWFVVSLIKQFCVPLFLCWLFGGFLFGGSFDNGWMKHWNGNRYFPTFVCVWQLSFKDSYSRFLHLKRTKTPPSRDPLKLIEFGDFVLTSGKTLMENANELVIQLVQVAFLIEVMPVQIYRVLSTSMWNEDKKFNQHWFENYAKISRCKLKALVHCFKFGQFCEECNYRSHDDDHHLHNWIFWNFSNFRKKHTKK